MRKLLDWSRPRTWMVVGLLIGILGSVVMSLEDSENGVGQALVLGGVMFMVIGFLAFLVAQVLKAVAASKQG